MSIRYFEYSRWANDPGPGVEFERETEHCLFDARGRKTAKRTQWSRWYKTAEEVQALIDERKKREAANRTLNNKRNAAEDMFAALERLAHQHRDDLCLCQPVNRICAPCQAKAALAKARGEPISEGAQ